MDYGKFKYREAKKASRSQAQAEADPRQRGKVPSGNDEGRLQDQAAHLIKFLDEGDRPGYFALPRPGDGASGILVCG